MNLVAGALRVGRLPSSSQPILFSFDSPGADSTLKYFVFNPCDTGLAYPLDEFVYRL